MKHQLTYFCILILTLACNVSVPQPALVPDSVSETAPSLEVVPAAQTPEFGPISTYTLLYISGTMHIESKSDSWPRDVDAFLAFLEATISAGMRWSIGADVGWLEGGERVAEIIERAGAMGVQWDVHTHEPADRAKAAYLLDQYGVTPTSVVSGLRIEEFDGLLQPLVYQGYAWTPQVVWGGVLCVGHRPGCDDTSIALYRPMSSAEYALHNPNGALIRVGNTDHQLSTLDELLLQVAGHDFSDVPVLSFTVMVEPETLQIVNSEDGLTELLAFVERVHLNPSVRFGTIEEAAFAWEAAGSVPIQIP